MIEGCAPSVQANDCTEIQSYEQQGDHHDAGDGPTRTRRRGKRRDSSDDHGGCAARQRRGKNVLPDSGDDRGDHKAYRPSCVPERGDREQPERRNPGHGDSHRTPREPQEKEQARHGELYDPPAEPAVRPSDGKVDPDLDEIDEHQPGRGREEREDQTRLLPLWAQQQEQQALQQMEQTQQQAEQQNEEAQLQAQQAEQVTESLKATITGLEAKLKETEDTLHRKDTAGQNLEETLKTEIRDLQSLVKKKDEALEGRDSELTNLKSKRDGLAEQITQLELAIQQAKGEAASQAQHAAKVIEGLKIKIATLEAQRRQPEQMVGGIDWTIKGLDQDGDRQVTDINAELDLQTNRTKKAAGVTSVIEKPARKTVSQDAFDRLIAEFSELTNVIESIASLIVRDHVRALGESMEEFPQRRLTELLESLSGQIADAKLKAKFRERIY